MQQTITQVENKDVQRVAGWEGRKVEERSNQGPREGAEWRDVDVDD